MISICVWLYFWEWGRDGGGGMNWEIGIDMYTLMCIKWMTNKNPLYKKNKIQNKKSNKYYRRSSDWNWHPLS